MLKFLLRNKITPVTKLKDDKLKQYELKKQTNTGITFYIVFPFSSVQFSSVQFSSVIQSHLTLCYPMNRSTSALCPSSTTGVHSNSCPSHWWCHPTISPSVIPFSHLQSFWASGFLPVTQFFASGGQSIGVSASSSILPMNSQDSFHLGLTDWISLLSKGLSRVFSSTTVQKHQFFGTQLSLYSNSHIHTWLLEKP